MRRYLTPSASPKIFIHTGESTSRVTDVTRVGEIEHALLPVGALVEIAPLHGHEFGADPLRAVGAEGYCVPNQHESKIKRNKKACDHFLSLTLITMVIVSRKTETSKDRTMHHTQRKYEHTTFHI